MTDAAAPLNLLEALTEHDDFETAIYCTYGTDLAFFEEAVLRPLRANRCRRHIIFMDSKRYADTIEQWRDCTRFAGQHYLIVPVQLPPYQAFHPKLTLLLGAQRGRLLLGSGNLTFTGFGHNHELYSCLDWTLEQPQYWPLFQSVWQFIERIQLKWGHSQLVGETLRKINYRHPWLHRPSAAAPPQALSYHDNLQAPLLDQLAAVVGTAQVRRLTIVTPFLDRRARAVAALNRRFQPQAIRLVLQDEQAVGDPAALADLQNQSAPLTLHRFGAKERYLHAKLLLLETDTAVFAVSGSANCTAPALLAIPESRGNVETILVRRAESVDPFAHLLPAELVSAESVAPTDLQLRSPTDAKGEDEAETAAHPVQLLDVHLASGQIHLRARLLRTWPVGRGDLQIRLDTESPFTLSLALNGDVSEIDAALRLEADVETFFDRPVSCRLVSVQDGELETVSNAVWITNVTALKQAAKASLYGGGAAANVLSEIVAESEAEWRDLYTAINELIELEVKNISQRPTMAARETLEAVHKTLKPEDKETNITLADDDNKLGLAEEERVAASLFHESQLQAFFDRVRQSLPGKPAAAQTQRSLTHTAVVPPKRKWTPERRTRTRFINLVKKYIASLRNPQYRQQAASRGGLAQYVIFQRVIQLLYSHHGLEDTDYVAYLRELNANFFGVDPDTPPIASPTLRYDCRYAWHEAWQETAAPFHALAALWQIEQLAAQYTDLLPSAVWEAEKRCVLAYLRVVTDTDTLRHQLETLAPPVQEVAHLYGESVEQTALALLTLWDSQLPEITEILQRWAATAVFDPEEMDDPYLERLTYQANVDYRRALLQTMAQMEQSDRVRQVIAELAFWSRRANANDEADQWQARLVALYRKDGDLGEAARALYRRGRQHFTDKRYEQARQLLQQAIIIIEGSEYQQLRQRCQALMELIRT